MTMTSLLIPKKTKKDRDKTAEVAGPYGNEDRYPYGSTLGFEKDQIGKIDVLKTVAPEQEVVITARGFINNVRVNDKEERSNVDIQITDIEILPRKELKDMNMKEYAKARGKNL